MDLSGFAKWAFWARDELEQFARMTGVERPELMGRDALETLLRIRAQVQKQGRNETARRVLGDMLSRAPSRDGGLFARALSGSVSALSNRLSQAVAPAERAVPFGWSPNPVAAPAASVQFGDRGTIVSSEPVPTPDLATSVDVPAPALTTTAAGLSVPAGIHLEVIRSGDNDLRVEWQYSDEAFERAKRVAGSQARPAIEVVPVIPGDPRKLRELGVPKQGRLQKALVPGAGFVLASVGAISESGHFISMAHTRLKTK